MATSISIGPSASPTRLRRMRHRQGGAASLIVVMVLFFLVALVAAYTSRNLIFEQRTSVNQVRSMQVFEAAEAGLEWGIAQLNGGRIGDDCTEAAATPADASFRQRYLQFNVDGTSATAGRISALLQSDGTTALRPTCVWNGTGWVCHCPTTSAPSLSSPSGTALYPAFRLKFTTDSITKAGLVRIEVTACTKLTDTCLDSSPYATDQDGRAQMTALVALKPAIPVAPGATLTARSDIVVPTLATLSVSAGDLGGKAVRTGYSVIDSGGLTVQPAGTPRSALVSQGDTALRVSSTVESSPGVALSAAEIVDLGFGMALGAAPASYKWQPAALRVTCAAGGCRTDLANTASMNPDRVIWVAGDLTLESAGDVGTPDSPVTLIVEGDINLAANSRVYGFVYARGSNFAGTGSIQGAVFFEGGLTLSSAAAPTLTLDADVLNRLVLRSGSFVRLPGGWQDFVRP